MYLAVRAHGFRQKPVEHSATTLQLRNCSGHVKEFSRGSVHPHTYVENVNGIEHGIHARNR
jgi:hypothetical protein